MNEIMSLYVIYLFFILLAGVLGLKIKDYSNKDYR